MLFALIGFTVFSLCYYGLWSLWCRYAPNFLSPSAPGWIRRPNFFLFFFVTLIFVLVYQSASKK